MPHNSARLVLAKNTQTRGVFRKRCRITRFEHVILLAPPNKKEEEYSRAPKARAEKIWYILCVLYASMPVFEAGLGKKTARTRQSFKTFQKHALTNTPFRARLATQRKKSILERRKLCTFLRMFYVKMSSCDAGFSKSARTRQSFEDAQESPHTEYVILRAPITQRKRNIRERRRRERRKFWTFYACYTQKALLRGSL